MHDSLAKTVHGSGSRRWPSRGGSTGDPPGAVEDARKLAADARTAAQEARELLSGLRGRDDPSLPLPTAIRSEAARWAERTGVRVGGSLDDVGPLPSLVLRELGWILEGGAGHVERTRARRAVSTCTGVVWVPWLAADRRRRDGDGLRAAG